MGNSGVDHLEKLLFSLNLVKKHLLGNIDDLNHHLRICAILVYHFELDPQIFKLDVGIILLETSLEYFVLLATLEMISDRKETI